MICYFKRTFLKDLTEVPASYRKKIEKMVFEDIPSLHHITDKIDLKKDKGLRELLSNKDRSLQNWL